MSEIARSSDSTNQESPWLVAAVRLLVQCRGVGAPGVVGLEGGCGSVLVRSLLVGVSKRSLVVLALLRREGGCRERPPPS